MSNHRISNPLPKIYYGLLIAFCLVLLSGCDKTEPAHFPQPGDKDTSVSTQNIISTNTSVNLPPELPFATSIPGLTTPPKLDCNHILAPNAKHFYCLGNVDGKKKSSLWRWDPFTGKLDEYQLIEDLFLSAGDPDNFRVIEIGDKFVLITNQLRLFVSGKPTMVDEVRYWVDEGAPFKDSYYIGSYSRKMIILPDQSIISLVQNSDVVEIISINNDKLSYDRLPKLPGSKRGGFALVALADGRVMALGGNVSQYMGCSPCVADTYFLDLKTKTWSEGPKMTEPRSDASATLLPDGNVLVAGGWTPGHGAGGWGVLSRTVEHWDVAKNAFIKNSGTLPTGVARHQALWASWEKGKQLLIAGGNSAAVQAYDVVNDVWRQAGEFCEGDERGNRTVISGVINGQRLMIHGRGGTCYGTINNTVAQLRLNDENNDQESALHIDSNRGATLFRSGFAYLPGKGEQPSLVLDGSINAGMNAYYYTAAVDAIWPDGRIQALPAFNHARSGAQVFRLSDNSILLVGGQIDKGNDSPTVEKQFPAELLPGNIPLNQARWIPLEGDWGRIEKLVQLADDSFFNLTTDGNVKIIRLAGAAQGKLVTAISELPMKPRARRHESGSGHLQNITAKELPDGRVVVAGGNAQEHRIALLQENSSETDAPDEYIWIGDFLPTDSYDIYESATKTWRESARSKGNGGLTAILDDGRVVRFGKQPEGALMEISSADGKSWSALSEEKPLVRLESDSNLFVEQGELFLAGRMDVTNVSGCVASLLWFNTTSRHWETIWQAAPNTNWRYYVGQTISRKLSNSKIVTLPVAGL